MCMNKFDAKKIIIDKFALRFLNLGMFKQLFICVSLRDEQADRKSKISKTGPFLTRHIQPHILKHLNAKNMPLLLCNSQWQAI